jgi:hypothetical protein
VPRAGARSLARSGAVPEEAAARIANPGAEAPGPQPQGAARAHRFEERELTHVDPSPQPSPRKRGEGDVSATPADTRYPSPRPSAGTRGEGDIPAAPAVDLPHASTRAGARDTATRFDASTRATLNTNAADATQDGRNAGVSQADCRILSSFFQDRVDDPREARSKALPSTTAKWVDPYDLEGWYRYGDSNPGPVAENHVS